jgi:hypothetical protein
LTLFLSIDHVVMITPELRASAYADARKEIMALQRVNALV